MAYLQFTTARHSRHPDFWEITCNAD